MRVEVIRARPGNANWHHRALRRHRVTREGVCFRAHGPTHPMDGSQPRRWARRTFLNGKSDDWREGAPAPPAHMCHIALHRLPDASLARVFVLTVRRRRAPPTTPPPTAPSPPPQPQPLPLHRRRRRRLHRRLHCHRHRPSPPRRGTAAGATGAARRVQGGQERDLQRLGGGQMVVGGRGGVAGTACKCVWGVWT